jgi:TolA-binding protein
MNIAMKRAVRPICLLWLAGCLGDPGAHVDRAQELAFQRQAAKALKEYEEALSLLAKKDPQKVRALLVPSLKGAGDLCYLELKQYPKAVDYYRALVQHFPDATESLDARVNLSEIFRSAGDRRSAVAELSAIVQDFPNGPEVDRYQYQAAKEYFELRDYDQVMLEAQILEKRFPSSSYLPAVQMLAAAALALQGQREKAIEAYERVAQRWPESDLAPRARFEAAKVWVDLGREDRALDMLVEVLKTHPDPKGVQAEIARLRKRLGLRRLTPEKTDRATVWPEFFGRLGRHP